MIGDVGHAIGFIPSGVADAIRVVIWLSMTFLVARMGFRAFRQAADPNVSREAQENLMLGRAALVLLLGSRALLMAMHWNDPLTWESTPATVIAIVLVGLSSAI